MQGLQNVLYFRRTYCYLSKQYICIYFPTIGDVFVTRRTQSVVYQLLVYYFQSTIQILTRIDTNIYYNHCILISAYIQYILCYLSENIIFIYMQRVYQSKHCCHGNITLILQCAMNNSYSLNFILKLRYIILNQPHARKIYTHRNRALVHDTYEQLSYDKHCIHSSTSPYIHCDADNQRKNKPIYHP